MSLVIDSMIKEMPKYEDNQLVWFLPSSTHRGKWDIVLKGGDVNAPIGEVDMHQDPAVVTSINEDYIEKRAIIEADANIFLLRPEVFLSEHAFRDGQYCQTILKDVYEMKLAGCFLVKSARLGLDPDKYLKPLLACADWLETTDFYNAPGSAQYHDSQPTGLVLHSFNVLNRTISLLTLPEFQSVHLESAVLVALCHDWCKIGMYESFMRNVKNELTGKWEQVPSYRHNPKGVPLGHGTASMFLASKFFRLSTEESVAIRWHMGAWYVCDSERNELQKSNESFPLVHLIQFADQLSITDYANHTINSGIEEN